MPRYVGYNRPVARGTGLVDRGRSPLRNNYKSEQTGQRRHDYLAGAPNIGTPLTLASEDYLLQTICRFRRSFSGADGEPTATSGNNYQTADVMNGSEIRDIQSLIRMTNKSNADPATLTVYKIALSFWDALVLQTNDPTHSVFNWVTTANNEGEVAPKILGSLRVGENSLNNSRFLQHYYQKMGEITLGQEGSGKETVEININGVPPKCKRSQTGMYYGYLFYADSDKNEGRTLSLDYSFRNHFIEIPANNRLPWLA